VSVLLHLCPPCDAVDCPGPMTRLNGWRGICCKIARNSNSLVAVPAKHLLIIGITLDGQKGQGLFVTGRLSRDGCNGLVRQRFCGSSRRKSSSTIDQRRSMLVWPSTSYSSILFEVVSGFLQRRPRHVVAATRLCFSVWLSGDRCSRRLLSVGVLNHVRGQLC